MIKTRVVMGSPACITFSGGRGCPSCLRLGIYQEEKGPKWDQNIVGPSWGLGASLPCAGRPLVLKLGGSYGGWILPKDITHLSKTPRQARGCCAAVTAKRVALLPLACPTEPVGQGHPREGATEVALLGPPRFCAKYQLLGCFLSWKAFLGQVWSQNHMDNLGKKNVLGLIKGNGRIAPILVFPPASGAVITGIRSSARSLAPWPQCDQGTCPGGCCWFLLMVPKSRV